MSGSLLRSSHQPTTLPSLPTSPSQGSEEVCTLSWLLRSQYLTLTLLRSPEVRDVPEIRRPAHPGQVGLQERGHGLWQLHRGQALQPGHQDRGATPGVSAGGAARIIFSHECLNCLCFRVKELCQWSTHGQLSINKPECCYLVMRRQFNVNSVCVGQMMCVTLSLVLRVSMIIGQGVKVKKRYNE